MKVKYKYYICELPRRRLFTLVIDLLPFVNDAQVHDHIMLLASSYKYPALSDLFQRFPTFFIMVCFTASNKEVKKFAVFVSEQ